MRRRLTLLFALAMLAAGPAAAQKPEDIVRWSAKAPATTLKRGGTVAIQIKAEIASGWHMYALTQLEGGPPPLEVALAKGQPFTLDAQRIEGPLPGVTKGAAGEPDIFQYDDAATLSVPVGAPKTMKPGKHTASIEVTYQVCSGSICLRPATTTLPVAIAIR